MLPERLAAYLTYLSGLANQPANRWEGFATQAPDGPETSLSGQISFAGCALAALATHPGADPLEQSRARSGLAQLIDRMIQRRVWAGWAAATERAGRIPDPIAAGNAGYSGALAMLLGLYSVAGGDRRFADPFILHWSSEARFSYDQATLIGQLWQQLRASPDGAIVCEPDLARPQAMAQVLWALRLHDRAFGSDYAAVGELWLGTLRERMAMRGPRLPGRGALAASYNPRRRAASLSSDLLSDAWALALTAPLAPELARALAQRHWPTIGRGEPGAALPLAFSYLLAVELGERERAAELLAACERRLGPQEDECGRRFTSAPAPVWATALIAIGEAGGLGRLL